MYAEPAVIVGIIAINLPFTVLTLQSVFEGIDPRLEEAAASMGAAPSRAFWRVVFPLALPGIAIAAVLCFILCMNAFATPVLLGGPRFQMMAPLLLLGVQQRQQLAVRRGDRVHPDGDHAGADRAGGTGGAAAVAGVKRD